MLSGFTEAIKQLVRVSRVSLAKVALSMQQKQNNRATEVYGLTEVTHICVWRYCQLVMMEMLFVKLCSQFNYN